MENNAEKINSQDSITESTSTKREAINDIESNTDFHLESSTTDSKGSLKIDKVSVGQETGIDKLSFIIDRDNLSERVA